MHGISVLPLDVPTENILSPSTIFLLIPRVVYKQENKSRKNIIRKDCPWVFILFPLSFDRILHKDN